MSVHTLWTEHGDRPQVVPGQRGRKIRVLGHWRVESKWSDGVRKANGELPHDIVLLKERSKHVFTQKPVLKYL